MELDVVEIPGLPPDEELLALDEALHQLTQVDPAAACQPRQAALFRRAFPRAGGRAARRLPSNRRSDLALRPGRGCTRRCIPGNNRSGMAADHRRPREKLNRKPNRKLYRDGRLAMKVSIKVATKFAMKFPKKSGDRVGQGQKAGWRNWLRRVAWRSERFNRSHRPGKANHDYRDKRA